MAYYETERSFKEKYLYHQTDINLKFPMHLHNSFEFIAVKEGSLNITIEANNYILNSGDCVIILPNQAHSYQTPNYSSTYLCVFSTDFATDFYDKTAGLYAESPIFNLSYTDNIIYELQNPCNEYRQKSLFYYIFSVFYSNGNLKKSTWKNNDFIHKVLSYIEEHYEDDLTLMDIASDIGYTYNYTSDLFHDSFNIDFPQLLNECRIHHVCRLLTTTNETISKIAMSCGYNSLRSFNRNFIKIKNMTPSEFIKKNNKENKKTDI